MTAPIPHSPITTLDVLSAETGATLHAINLFELDYQCRRVLVDAVFGHAGQRSAPLPAVFRRHDFYRHGALGLLDPAAPPAHYAMVAKACEKAQEFFGEGVRCVLDRVDFPEEETCSVELYFVVVTELRTEEAVAAYDRLADWWIDEDRCIGGRRLHIGLEFA